MKFLFCSTQATQFSLVHPEPLFHLPHEQSNCAKANPGPSSLDSAGIRSLSALPSCMPLLCFSTQAVSEAIPCHPSSYCSLNIQMLLFFCLSRSWIASSRKSGSWKTFSSLSYTRRAEVELFTGGRGHVIFYGTDMSSVTQWPAGTRSRRLPDG